MENISREQIIGIIQFIFNVTVSVYIIFKVVVNVKNKFKKIDLRFFSDNIYNTYSNNLPNLAEEHKNKPDVATTYESPEERVLMLEKQVNELERAKRRDFIRHHHYCNIVLKDDDPYTLNLIMNFQKEKGIIKSIPYLDEFYKRLFLPKFFNTWLIIPPQEKERLFNELINKVDIEWGGDYVPAENKAGAEG
jgi:hypothetical protein